MRFLAYRRHGRCSRITAVRVGVPLNERLGRQHNFLGRHCPISVLSKWKTCREGHKTGRSSPERPVVPTPQLSTDLESTVWQAVPSDLKRSLSPACEERTMMAWRQVRITSMPMVRPCLGDVFPVRTTTLAPPVCDLPTAATCGDDSTRTTSNRRPCLPCTNTLQARHGVASRNE